MKLSVSQKVFSVTLLATLVLGVVLAGAFRQFYTIRDGNQQVLLLGSALQTQQYADMMHDAIRGDAIAALLAGRGQHEAQLVEVEKDFNDHVADIRGRMKENSQRDLGPDIAARIAAIDQPLERYVAMAGKSVAAARQDTAAADATFAPLQDSFHEMEVAMASLSEAIGADAEHANKMSAESLAAFGVVVGYLAGGGLVFLVVLSALVARSIPRPFATVIRQLGQAAEANAESSALIAQNSTALAEGATEQAASLEETSSSLEEISSMAKRNSDSAQRANELSRQTRSAADAGARDVQEMNLAMDAIRNSSDGIAKIIKTIDEIAFQTNILALNAAVEAARAGEAGAGFAVVADEVRALAQRSALAAKETAEKIDDAMARSRHGVAVCAKVAAGLQEIELKSRQVDELVGAIALASSEQTQGIGQVNTAVSQMDKVVQGGAARAEEGASVACQLAAQSTTLQQGVQELTALVGGGSLQPATAQPPGPRAPAVVRAGAPAEGRRVSGARKRTPALAQR